MCAADPRLRMTEERREGEGRRKAPLGKRVGRRSAATIEPREMDSTAKDFLLYTYTSHKIIPTSAIFVHKTIWHQTVCRNNPKEIQFSYCTIFPNPLVEWKASLG